MFAIERLLSMIKSKCLFKRVVKNAISLCLLFKNNLEAA